jgi:hypothetical protein
MNLIFVFIGLFLISTNARSIKSNEFGLLGNDTKTWSQTHGTPVVEQIPNVEQTIIENACDSCKLTQNLIQSEMINQIYSLMDICNKLPEKNQDDCRITIDASTQGILDYLSEENICKDLNICEEKNSFKKIFYFLV